MCIAVDVLLVPPLNEQKVKVCMWCMGSPTVPEFKRDVYTDLVTAITNGNHSNLFSPDNKKRIQYFVEDLRNRETYSISNSDAEKLAQSFASLKIYHHMRKKGVGLADETNFRNFFDDISLSIAKSKSSGQVKIPSLSELERIYQESLKH